MGFGTGNAHVCGFLAGLFLLSSVNQTGVDRKCRVSTLLAVMRSELGHTRAASHTGPGDTLVKGRVRRPSDNDDDGGGDR